MALGNGDAMRVLVVGRPFVLGIQNQVVSYCGVGLCDPILRTSVNALQPFRFATVLFAWSLPEDGGNLTIPTGQQRQAFTSGIGETIPGGWWIQTASDTDLFTSGAPVNRGFMFLVTGLTTNALDPFQRGGTGASAADPRFYSSWLNQSENGSGYAFTIQRALINYVALEFDFEDQGTRYRVGPCGFYPTWGDPSGAQTVRNGLTCMPGAYVPFTTALCVGSRDDVQQLTVTLTMGQSCEIQNDAGGRPTISGSEPATEGSINEANDGTVYGPVRIVLVGYIVCVPFENYCGIPTLSPDEIMLLRARLGIPQQVGPQVVPGTIGSAPLIPGAPG